MEITLLDYLVFFVFVGGVALSIAGLMLSNRKGSRRGQRRGHASPSSS